jgi:hypothetical protein
LQWKILVHFVAIWSFSAIWCILWLWWSLGIFFPFWYVVSRKIWQPCFRGSEKFGNKSGRHSWVICIPLLCMTLAMIFCHFSRHIFREKAFPPKSKVSMWKMFFLVMILKCTVSYCDYKYICTKLKPVPIDICIYIGTQYIFP